MIKFLFFQIQIVFFNTLFYAEIIEIWMDDKMIKFLREKRE